MVDAYDIIDYNRSDNHLEEYLLFSVVVAGKTATTQARALETFLLFSHYESPFEAIRDMIARNKLEYYLRLSKLGQYTKLTKSFTQIATSDINLRTCNAADLESIHGIGPKTARFFLLYTRPDQQCAVLDTHILRFMREKLGIMTPKTTPSAKKYALLEQQFLDYVKTTGRKVADVDLEIWSAYSSKSDLIL